MQKSESKALGQKAVEPAAVPMGCDWCTRAERKHPDAARALSLNCRHISFARHVHWPYLTATRVCGDRRENRGPLRVLSMPTDV